MNEILIFSIFLYNGIFKNSKYSVNKISELVHSAIKLKIRRKKRKIKLRKTM